MKKPYVEPEIEIENITSLSNFLEASTGGWEGSNPDGDDFNDPQDPWG